MNFSFKSGCIIVGLVFCFNFFNLSARLSYHSLTGEKNYFFHFGYGLNLNKLEEYNLGAGLSWPWLWFNSEIDYLYSNNHLVKTSTISTYHNYTWSGLRIYGGYEFDLLHRKEKTIFSNQQLHSGLNLFYSFILFGLQLDTTLLNPTIFTYHASITFNFYQENKAGLIFTLKNERVIWIPFIEFNLKNFFIKLEYNLNNHIFIFSLNFLTSIFRGEAILSLRPTSASLFKNKLFFISNSSNQLISF